jgi:lipopolysaccharide transport system permease protein
VRAGSAAPAFSKKPRPMSRASAASLLEHSELIRVLAWKNITVRYKQAYLGLAWAVIRPLMLMLTFSLLRVFIGIDSGSVPYPVLAYAALLPWMFFQDSSSEGVGSVVGNAHLIRKIYFPREVFPVTAVISKLVEFGINLLILGLLMAYFGILPTVQALWIPLLVLYTMLAALCIALVGSAVNVYYRDAGAAIPVLLSLMMYVSPVIYPLTLVQDKLLAQQAAGDWSNLLYTLYTLNPLAGVIDAFQRVLLKGLPPDPVAIMPGLILTVVALPVCYLFFKRAEDYFADVI